MWRTGLRRGQRYWPNRRERPHGDECEKKEMQPGEVAIRTGELAELRLLANPEDAQRQAAQEPWQESRRRGRKRVEEFSLRVDIGCFGRVKVEHQNRRRNGENAIAERRDTADLFTG